MPRKILLSLLLFFWSSDILLSQALLTSNLQDSISKNVFEVVIEKPAVDPLSYQKPLPLDRIPYAERIDKYFSIGTAFSIGKNKFVSAAHVFSLDSQTLSKNIALRDSTGNIYPVDKIIGYDNRKDYIVFTVPTLIAPGLNVSNNFLINSKVYAVGNALGEGIIIRDGILTSMTPESQNGEWRWLRFSAAASPGNSGGPLIDESGNVIGIVEMKSPNENLNYALPLSELTSNSVAKYEIKYKIHFPASIFDSEVDGKTNFKLPLPIDTLRTELTKYFNKSSISALDSITNVNSDKIFPAQQSSQAVLGKTFYTKFPFIVDQKDDSTWQIDGISKPNSAKVGKDCSMEYADLLGYTFFSFIKSSDLKTEDLFNKPKILMNFLLQGIKLTRPIDTEKIPISSFGEPDSSKIIQDAYGRIWMMSSWKIPFANYSITMIALPTPTGTAGLIVQNPYAYREIENHMIEMMANYIYISYSGNLKVWKDFMLLKDIKPAFMKSVSLTYSAGDTFTLDTPRFNMTYTPSIMSISDENILTVVPAYYSDNQKTVWDIATVYIEESSTSKTSLNVSKYFKPADDDSDKYKKLWASLVNNKYPFDGNSYKDEGARFLNGTVHTGYAGKQFSNPLFLYGIWAVFDGNLTEGDSISRFNQLKSAFRLTQNENKSAANTSLPGTEYQGNVHYQWKNHFSGYQRRRFRNLSIVHLFKERY